MREGPDVSTLGTDTGSPPAPRPLPTPPTQSARATERPPTPMTVPTTPASTSSLSPVPRPLPSSPSSSSIEVFYDADDPDVQTKRRSLYRSPGTASSPDLATLLRKAKERGGFTASNYRKDKQTDPLPPLPPPSPNLAERFPTTNQRPQKPSANTVPGVVSDPQNDSTTQHAPEGVKPAAEVEPSISTEWVLTSPRSRKPSKDSSAYKVLAAVVVASSCDLVSYIEARSQNHQSAPRLVHSSEEFLAKGPLENAL